MGYAQDRFGSYRPCCYAAACCSIGCLLHGLVPAGDYMVFYLSSVMIGQGIGQ